MRLALFSRTFFKYTAFNKNLFKAADTLDEYKLTQSTSHIILATANVLYWKLNFLNLV